MTKNIYNTPQSSLEDHTSKADFEVWNPDVAGAWSLIFTPIFGSIIVHKNWIALGNTEKANESKKWIYISLFIALISFVVNLVGFVYIVTWYYMSQKKQTQHLKVEFSGRYKKRSWRKPLGIAFTIWLTIFTCLVVVFL